MHTSDTRPERYEQAGAGSQTTYGDPVPPWPPPPGFVPLGSLGSTPGRDTTGVAELASWGSRLGALVLDSIVVGVPGLMVWALFAIANEGLLGQLLVTAGSLLYFAVLDGRGQTIGKRTVGIAVRDERSGKPIGFARALGRWLIFSVLWYGLFVPGMANALSPFWDRRNKAWHDHAVGSVVVRTGDRESTFITPL